MLAKNGRGLANGDVYCCILLMNVQLPISGVFAWFVGTEKGKGALCVRLCTQRGHVMWICWELIDKDEL